MQGSTGKKGYAFDRPGTYRIRVLGSVDESWADRLGEMKLSKEHDTELGTVTTMTGTMTDQAALSGVLKTLYELHLTLLSVEALKNGIEAEE